MYLGLQLPDVDDVIDHLRQVFALGHALATPMAGTLGELLADLANMHCQLTQQRFSVMCQKCQFFFDKSTQVEINKSGAKKQTNKLNKEDG